MLGDWLNDRGSISALVLANIASTGTEDSLIKASLVTKTQLACQVTAASVPTLLNRELILSTHQKQLRQGQKFLLWKDGGNTVTRDHFAVVHQISSRRQLPAQHGIIDTDCTQDVCS